VQLTGEGVPLRTAARAGNSAAIVIRPAIFETRASPWVCTDRPTIPVSMMLLMATTMVLLMMLLMVILMMLLMSTT
jgi:hypothetical protein